MSNVTFHTKNNEALREIEVIYKALRSQCKSIRSQRSIDIINETCAEIAIGSRDFSASIVGKLSHTRGGPSAQSISNKNGKRYRDLISSYHRAYPSPTKQKTLTNKNWIHQIQQPGVKGNVLIMQSDLKKLRDENKVLRNLLANKDDLVVTLTQTSHQSDNPFPHLTETDHESLKSAINPERLKMFGLRLGEAGSIENETGAEVFEIGFTDAIKKIITIDGTQDG